MTSLHRKNGLVLLALIALAPGLALATGESASRFYLGVALGGGLQALNLVLLERVVAGLLATAECGERPAVAAVVALRLVGLLLAVGFVLLALPVDPLALVLGLSSAVPAVIWHGLAERPVVGGEGA